ncbi:Coenzyme F420 hydrogenase/dehydrogenase, beta subunit C-terminal domain [Parabacteroides sp. AD58]|uniref:Coenzyme F420 hydrogenase/dehydrogenase, beta subunit C-terminal domain n=1 Tax=Parabacteroides absconsus TaxID=2951805 RepID=A0ABZ2IIA9_9BACT|nr:Coenzyme F420 hydrogenase/dehydrogenase, beta subunit C-terminal domain [Parabacteroides sp. AD58]MCM6903263.1 Coenzyme F420 hydrogenase/dehydrogenase, beta subunit C-terminal domain [Parabacteroides sp. AD58]
MVNIINKADCCGCTACASICTHSAITMQPDIEGFLYPAVNSDLCTNCGLCEKVCPTTYYDALDKAMSSPKIYALRNRDSKILKTSSSGGVFAELVSYTLSKDGVVYGAVYDENFHVIHRLAKNETEALQIRGSKYVQSDLRGIYKDIRDQLRKNQFVLFSGTPCQVQGLKNFLIKPYVNLLTVDIMCHCVPSPRVYDDYLHFIQKTFKSSISSIFMKDKTLGWGKQRLRISFSDGKEIFDTPESNLWNQLFYSQLISRPSCHECRFSNYQHPGDLTIGDYWGIEKVHPEFYDSNGVSLLFTNTDKGETVFSDIKDSFFFIESTKDHCVQPNLISPVESNPLREMFWLDYDKKTFRSIAVKYFNYGLRNKVKGKLRSIVKNVIHICRV